MIEYHKLGNSTTVAEILPGSPLIACSGEMLDLMAEAGYQNCSALIIHRETFHADFFDLKTGLAGEILQKFSNYRMRLSIVGDFSDLRSKSLNDFIRESNRTGIICFVKSTEEALSLLDKYST